MFSIIRKVTASPKTPQSYISVTFHPGFDRVEDGGAADENPHPETADDTSAADPETTSKLPTDTKTGLVIYVPSTGADASANEGTLTNE